MASSQSPTDPKCARWHAPAGLQLSCASAQNRPLSPRTEPAEAEQNRKDRTHLRCKHRRVAACTGENGTGHLEWMHCCAPTPPAIPDAPRAGTGPPRAESRPAKPAAKPPTHPAHCHAQRPRSRSSTKLQPTKAEGLLPPTRLACYCYESVGDARTSRLDEPAARFGSRLWLSPTARKRRAAGPNPPKKLPTHPAHCHAQRPRSRSSTKLQPTKAEGLLPPTRLACYYYESVSDIRTSRLDEFAASRLALTLTLSFLIDPGTHVGHVCCRNRFVCGKIFF
jgi:hypothetical protein